MLKPRPLFPGPRPPYLEAYVKTVASKVDLHLADKDDPHETLKKVPLVYAGTVPPVADATKYKDTDLYIDTVSGKVYRMVSSVWTEIGLKSKDLMAGRVVPLDTENDLYAAVQEILEKMGATVS